MDRYKYLKKLFNMSEETVKKQIPVWYARLKSNHVSNRIFSNAIDNPNSQLVKALLFTEFKLPMNNEYTNIVNIFQAVLRSKNADQALVNKDSIVLETTTLSDVIRAPRRANIQQTEASTLADMTIECDEWWGERTEYWRVDETRFQRSSDEPLLYMEDIIEKLIEGVNEGNLEDLTEYIEDVASDPDGESYYETENTEQTDEDFVETGSCDTGYNQNGTLVSILNKLEWCIDNPNDHQSTAVSNRIANTTDNRITLSGLTQLLRDNIY